jgi:hypothetical protein
MASLIKKNETVVAPSYKNGVTLQFFEIDFGANVSAKLTATAAGVRSPVAVALEAVQQVCNIEVVGTVQADSGSNAGQLLRIAVAAAGGAFGTSKWDGTNSETFAAYLQRVVQAAGTYQSVVLASATVTAYTF